MKVTGGNTKPTIVKTSEILLSLVFRRRVFIPHPPAAQKASEVSVGGYGIILLRLVPNPVMFELK